MSGDLIPGLGSPSESRPRPLSRRSAASLRYEIATLESMSARNRDAAVEARLDKLRAELDRREEAGR